MLRWLRRTLTEPPPQPTWVAVAWARNQFEAEMIVDILHQYGIPAFFRRTMGADLPELFAAGPRVVLAAAERAEEATELLDSLDVGDDPSGEVDTEP
jgi:hypothetical protein